MRLGVFLPNWIGDVVMATPALRAMRKLAGNDGKLIGVMRPYVADVLAGTGWLDHQIVYDKPKYRMGFARREVYQALREARLDRVILLTNSFGTAWMAWRSGARERFGYGEQARSWLLTNPIAHPSSAGGPQLATMDAYLQLAEASGCKPAPPVMELATTPADEAAADDAWKKLQLPPGDRVVVLNNGGAYGAAKLWVPEYFAALARRIVADGQYVVLVNCGPAEREVAREIAAQANDPRVVSLAEIEKLPLGLSKACLRRSRLVVTTDSGPRFFGIAFRRPVVTLFGPTNPLLTDSHYDAERCVSLSLDCQPCMKRVCPLGHHRCMRDLSVDMVYNVVAETLSKVEWAPPAKSLALS